MSCMLNVQILRYHLSSTHFLLLPSALSCGGGQNHDMTIFLFHIMSAVTTSIFSLLQLCDIKKMSLSSLLEASAKGKAILHRALFLYTGCFTISYLIVCVCKGLHLIDTDCYVGMYSDC
jgi:hypothetical protein